MDHRDGYHREMFAQSVPHALVKSRVESRSTERMRNGRRSTATRWLWLFVSHYAKCLAAPWFWPRPPGGWVQAGQGSNQQIGPIKSALPILGVTTVVGVLEAHTASTCAEAQRVVPVELNSSLSSEDEIYLTCTAKDWPSNSQKTQRTLRHANQKE